MAIRNKAYKDTEKQRTERYRRILAELPLYAAAAENSLNEQDGMKAVTCTCVIAPAANGYVQWLLSEALHRGVERIYFLARDAYLMYLTAKKYCEKFELPIDCRYLYCSRYSLRIPVYHRDMDAAMEYICRGGIDVTFRKILGRTGLSEEKKQASIDRLAAAAKAEIIAPYVSDPDKVIPYANLGSIRELLQSDRQLIEDIRHNSAEAAPALYGYLEQEGLHDDVRMVIADSGWVGSMQKSLGQAADRDFEGYYWGLYEIPADMPPERYHCYYFSPSGRLRGSEAVPGLNNTVRFSNCLFEGIFSAPHGMTLGYHRADAADGDGCIAPVLADCPQHRIAFIRETEQTILSFTDRLLEKVPGTANVKDFREMPHIPLKVADSLISTLMNVPCRAEAEIFGGIPFSDDVQSESSEPIAARLSESELTDNHFARKALNMLGSRKKHIRESAWYEGSAVLCSKHPGKHIRAYTQYKRALAAKKLIKYKKEHSN